MIDKYNDYLFLLLKYTNVIINLDFIHFSFKNKYLYISLETIIIIIIILYLSGNSKLSLRNNNKQLIIQYLV